MKPEDFEYTTRTGRAAGSYVRRTFIAVAVTVALTVTVIALRATAQPHPASANPNPGLAANGQQHPAAVTRTSGDSVVESWDSGNPEVNLRQCSHLPPFGDPTCGVADYLQSGDHVIMRCWEDTYPPNGETPPLGRDWSSPRWFYVNEVDGPHPGYSGYIYSDLVPVDQQVIVPLCTQQIYDTYQMPRYQPPPPLQFAVTGSCTTVGGTLTAVSSGFTPGAEYSISARYPDGSNYPLAYPSGTVRANGAVVWNWPCAGDPAGTYTTSLTDYGTGQDTGWVSFTIGSAPQGPAPTSAPSPAPAQNPPPQAGNGSAGSGPGGGTTAAPPTTPAPTTAPVAPPPSTQPPTVTLYTEQEGHHGVNTFTDPHNASGFGPRIQPAQYAQVSCKLHDPTIASVNPDGYWYRIASAPWNDGYYAPANTFMNGDPWGGPYTHNTDFNVPDC